MKHPIIYLIGLAIVLMVQSQCIESSKISFSYAYPDCDPLVPEEDLCSLPFPSNKYLIEDNSSPTGYRINLSEEAMPLSIGGESIYDQDYNTLDGYSPASQILCYFKDLNISNLPSIHNMEDSLNSDSPTLIIHSTTGEFIPHFAELDESGEDSPSELKTLIIRPAKRLDDNQNYIVVLRSLKDLNGNDIPPSPAFQYLRDGIKTDNNSLESRRARFEDMFTRLTDFGIERSSLILAWDFNTASQISITHRLLTMIEDAYTRSEVTGGIQFTIDKNETYTPAQNSYYYRRIDGHFQTPLYMDKDGTGARMVIDEAGNPVYSGTANVPFSIGIPHSAVDAHTPTPLNPAKTRLLQYGHGLFDSGKAIDYSDVASVGYRYNFILFATDWQGMSINDAFNVGFIVRDMKRFAEIPDRLHQGLLNFILLMEMMQTTFQTYNSGEFVNDLQTEGGLTGADAIEEGGFYYGYSQGGTFGATYLALSKVVDRGVLGVPGSPYALMLQRSVDFAYFEGIMKTPYPYCHQRTMILSYAQMLWDRTEPSGWCHYTLDDQLLAGRNNKESLILMGIDDHQVPNVSTHFLARSMNVQEMDYNTTTIWGLNTASAPYDGSGLVDFKNSAVPPNPITNTRPTGDIDPHYLAQGKPATKEMISYFLRENGTIEHTCSGPCDDDD